ncbi:MAG: hypothetical protein GX946_09510 [Oligosphaeraceae bacterium]|nr:hypothetical protein [Oligosphaeraceae bacterium]
MNEVKHCRHKKKRMWAGTQLQSVLNRIVETDNEKVMLFSPVHFKPAFQIIKKQEGELEA